LAEVGLLAGVVTVLLVTAILFLDWPLDLLRGGVIARAPR
jgi:Flp pilus assembly pilin Flp